MKRYILAAICCIATLVSYAQYPDCTQIDDFSPTISRWGAAYQPVPNELECWTIDLGVQGHAKITYNIDLELVGSQILYLSYIQPTAICLFCKVIIRHTSILL